MIMVNDIAGFPPSLQVKLSASKSKEVLTGISSSDMPGTEINSFTLCIFAVNANCQL